MSKSKAQLAQAEQDRKDSIESMFKYLNYSRKIYTTVNHVSSSGMTRHISCYVAGFESERDDKKRKYKITRTPKIINVTWHIGRILDYKRNSSNGGLVVGGCGMDMGFHLVYSLGRAMWPHGHKCFGDTCRSNDHVNDRDCDRVAGKHLHNDGGYAIDHEWL